MALSMAGVELNMCCVSPTHCYPSLSHTRILAGSRSRPTPHGSCCEARVLRSLMLVTFWQQKKDWDQETICDTGRKLRSPVWNSWFKSPTTISFGNFFFSFQKVLCATSSDQLFWKWHRRFCIAGTLEPRVTMKPKGVPSVSAWLATGRDKTSISGEWNVENYTFVSVSASTECEAKNKPKKKTFSVSEYHLVTVSPLESPKCLFCSSAWIFASETNFVLSFSKFHKKWLQPCKVTHLHSFPWKTSFVL